MNSLPTLPDFSLGAEAEESCLSPGSPELCEEHDEGLSLFCVDDLEPLCGRCAATGSHTGHRVYPLTEAAADCKEELRTSLDGLQEKVIRFENVIRICEHASKHNKAQAQLTQGQIKEDFEKLHQFLREEEEARLAALRKEHEQRRREAEESMDRMTQAMKTTEEKIQLIEEELDAEGDGVKFLQGYGEPEEAFRPLIDVAKHLGNLRYAIWDKMKHITCYIPVTLDPRTASQSLRLSPGLHSVQMAARPSQDLEQPLGTAVPVPANPERFHPYSCVLARESYDSGIHCWDIEVGDSNNWTIGVAGQSLCRREEFEACPEAGLWCISLREGEYQALTSPSQILHLDKSHRLKRVHVRLDCDEGQLDFTDADTGLHLFTFTHHFSEKVYPYFESISVCGVLEVLAQRVHVSVGSDPIPAEGAAISGGDPGEIIVKSTDKNTSTNFSQTQEKGSISEGKAHIGGSTSNNQLAKTKPTGRERKTNSKTPVSKTKLSYHISSLKRASNITAHTSDTAQQI
ncbi:tripartite motif-containing protein 35-like [Myripristis murdjan]|uniref:tripartite motif-containing protein 35-like n=1 Tax=Myripristis murdjan TaxID=586833 RepID=UPI0011760973|nr:tripartite motif-containing protein 35-like [Myripristis murdjan]